MIMNSKLILRSAFAILVGGTLLWAGDPWNTKSYRGWTKEEVQKVLKDSPWAKPVNLVLPQFPRPQVGQPQVISTRSADAEGQSCGTQVSYALPAPGSQPTPERFLTVLWYSALTARQALVRDLQLNGRPNELQVQQFLSWQPEHYVIAVYGPGIHRFGHLTEGAVRESAYLQLSHSQQKLSPVRVQFVRHPQGRLAEVRFHFQREVAGEPVIGPNEKKVEFSFGSTVKDIRVSFVLRRMAREGEPDL